MDTRALFAASTLLFVASCTEPPMEAPAEDRSTTVNFDAICAQATNPDPQAAEPYRVLAAWFSPKFKPGTNVAIPGTGTVRMCIDNALAESTLGPVAQFRAHFWLFTNGKPAYYGEKSVICADTGSHGACKPKNRKFVLEFNTGAMWSSHWQKTPGCLGLSTPNRLSVGCPIVPNLNDTQIEAELNSITKLEGETVKPNPRWLTRIGLKKLPG